MPSDGRNSENAADLSVPFHLIKLERTCERILSVDVSAIVYIVLHILSVGYYLGYANL